MINLEVILANKQNLEAISKIKEKSFAQTKVSELTGDIHFQEEVQTATTQKCCVLAQIKTRLGPGTYSVALYPNGKLGSSTGSSVVNITEIAYNQPIPTGTWIIAHVGIATVLGGN